MAAIHFLEVVRFLENAFSIAGFQLKYYTIYGY